MTEEAKPKKRSIMTTTQLQDPNVSVAKAIDSLTAKGLPLEMLSSISENDVPRLTVALVCGTDPDIDGTEFLARYSYTELALMNSVTMKRGGIRSEQITEIAKAPPLMTEQMGFFDKVRNRLSR